MGMELLEGLPDQVVGVRALGEIDDDDYTTVLEPAIRDKLSRHHKIRLLYVLGPEFTGYEAGAMWEDTKLGLATFADYERMAVVTDAVWLRRTVKAFGWLIPGEVAVFPFERLQEARTWVAG